MKLTVLASVQGTHVEVQCDTTDAAHLVARAISVAHPMVGVGIWSGMRNLAAYCNGAMQESRRFEGEDRRATTQ